MAVNARSLRPRSRGLTSPRQIAGLALWLDASATETLLPVSDAAIGDDFSPYNFSGQLPQLWVSADNPSNTVSGGRVVGLADMAGNADPMSTYPYSNSAITAPLLVPNAIGGRPVMRFNGTTDGLMTMPFLQDIALTLVTVAVVRVNSSSAVMQSVLAVEDYNQSIAYISVAANSSSLLGSSTSFGTNFRANAPKPVIVVTTFNPDNGERNVYHNGRLVSTGTDPDTFIETQYISLGRGPEISSGNPASCDIAEAIAYTETLSVAEINQLTLWLGNKYNIVTDVSPASMTTTAVTAPTDITGCAGWWDASDSTSLYTTDAGPVVAVRDPLDIAGCALWLDGADSSSASMTLSGSLVETWKDKSGGGRDFTATGTARPTLTASAINSRSAVTFNGSTNTLAGNAAAQDVIRNIAGYTVVAALRATSVAAGERLAFGVGSTVLFRIGQQDSRPFIGGRRVLADSLESITESTGAIAVNTPFIQSAVVNHTSQSLTGLRNGAVFATDSTYMGAGISENTASSVSVGTQGGGTYGFWDGNIAEIVVFNTALSATDRSRVEAYLAAKWSIAGVHAPATATNDPVGFWADKSGNGRNFVQSTPTLRPLLTASGRNGRSVVTFDATDDYMISAATQNIPQPATWMFVYKVPSSIASGWSLVDSTTDRVHVYSAAGSTITQYTAGGFFTTEASGVTADQWRIGTYHFNGASSLGKRDGVQTATGTTGTNAITGSITLGANNGGAAVLRSQMAEAILLTGASMADIARVESYLAAKWLTPTVPDPTPPVGAWLDKSGNNRHAVQATALSRPVVGAQNGRKALAFSGSNTRLTASIAPSDLCSATGGSVFVVVAPNTGVYNSFSNCGVIEGLDRYGDGTSYYGNFRTNRLEGVLPGCFNVTGAQIIASIASVGAQTVRKDGATVLSVASQIAGYRAVSPSLSVTIGATLNNASPVSYSYHLNGNVAEIICYNKPLGESDALKVERYLAARWNIPIAPRVSNSDAQNWIDRVYLNGGSVSPATAQAVNQFCNSINDAGIRDRFLRLNLFAGSFQGAFVPLFRGPSLGGTQYGNATDTNTGGLFVSGDYSESSGLLGNGSTKYLATGLGQNFSATKHISVFPTVLGTSQYKTYIGANQETVPGVGQTGAFFIENRASATTFQFKSSADNAYQLAATPDATAAAKDFIVASVDSIGSGGASLYVNGISSATAIGRDSSFSSAQFGIFCGIEASNAAGNFTNARIAGYSIGLSMTSSQVSAFNTAMRAFQTSLSRT